MSQPNTDPNLQNGLPYKWDGSKPPYGQYPLNNGLGGSSQSSRDSSPVPRFSNVPQSQLPPSRGQIPSSQLPPGRPSVSPIIGQQSAFKSASYINPNTPSSSPLINTSTPIMRRTDVNSAGNILTGNNLFVNNSLSSPSVPATMPNDMNVRTQRIPQTNGQSVNKQNLNQPLLISNMEPKHTGNLLTNQLDQAMPAFVPVNAQTVFPVPPNAKQEDKSLENTMQPNQDKPQNLQSHFMNPNSQAKFTHLAQSLPGQTSSLNDNKHQKQNVEKQNPIPGLFPGNEHQKNKDQDTKDNSNEDRKPSPQIATSIPKSSPSFGANQQNPLLSSASNPNAAQLSNQITNMPTPQSTTANNEVSSQNAQQHEANPPVTQVRQTNMPPIMQNGPPLSQNPITASPTGYNQPMRPPNQNTGPFNQNMGNPNAASQNQQGSNHQPQNMMYQQFPPIPNQKPTLPPNTNQNQGNLPPPLQQQGPLSNQNTGFQQYISPLSYQSGSKPTMPPIPSQSAGQNQQGSQMFNQLSAVPPTPNPSATNIQQGPTINKGLPMPPMTNPVMPPVSNQNSMVPPLPNQTTGNQQVMPPSSNQSGMPPMSNPNTRFQQFPLSNQNKMPPMPNQVPGSFPTQNVGYQQPSQVSNQNTAKPTMPPMPNENMGSNYPPPMQGQQIPTSQNYNQFGQYQNMPNQNQKTVNQNLVGPPQMPANVDPTKPPMYIEQKQENTSYPSTPTSALHKNRYAQNYQPAPVTYTTQNRQNAPNQMYQQSYGQNYQSLQQGMSNMNLGQTGFNRLYGSDNIDLLQCPNILPPERIEAPRVCLGQECLNNANCSPEIFRCTMTKIPETNALLQKSRLPLGVLIHPFKDLNHLPVIQCSSIVRCRACRTYINPFVYFVDTKRWKCNLCYRVNELPEEFQYDPVSKSYGDPSRRPEIKSSTIEYIAPSEYMLRPPQPAVYLFLLDVSRLAIESGYLHTICEVLTSQLQNLPGDSRTQVGFIAYNSTLHFYSLGEGLSQPHEMTVLEIDDVFLPCPDNLLVNLKERMELVTDLLALLPTRFINSYDNGSALGAAIQAAFKLMSPTGGRVTIFQCSLPTIGPGMLTAREDPNQRAGKEAPHLNPATDFYKRMALDCSGHQVAVDLFLLNSQYVDIATLSGISRFSGGCMHHFPLFKASKSSHAESLEKCFKRYLTRKIGFEAVMRIRCTRGLAIHTFHGNFFVRSTDLLSLPNINPDAGFGMQVSIEESLSDLQNVCFQAALLYTSSKGERRIRVHTLCLPVVNNLPEIINSADQQCIVGILSKMAVDRSLQSSLSDARDAFINVAIDILHSYKVSLNMGEANSGLLASHNLKLLPMYILALLKHTAFRTGMSTRLDDRVFAMCDMKTLPLCYLIQQVYPDLYPIHNLTDEGGIYDSEGTIIPQPPRLQLTSRNIDGFGAYLMDCGQQMIIFVCQKVSPSFLTHVLGVPNFNSISDQFHELPKIDNPDNQRLHTFIASLNDEKPYCASLHIMRENSPNRNIFLEKLIEDRMESALSYNEFLQHIKTQVK